MTTRLLPALTAIRRATIRDKLYEKRENPFIITAKHVVGRGNEPIVKQAEGRKKTNADDKIQGRVAESNFCGTPFLQTNQEKNGNIASKAAT